MIATVAVVSLLLAILAVPGFLADHQTLRSPLVVASLCVAVVMVAAVPVAIVRPGRPTREWLWVTVGAYGVLLAVEPLILRDPLPVGSTPWLLALSFIAFGGAAIVESSPVRAGIVCGVIDAALAMVYAGRIPVSHSIIDAVGLALLAAALIAGVKALRTRADRADRAERDAQLLFENHHRQMAIETERTRTDALLHDSVLASLLAAAGGEAPRRITGMARAALDIISGADDHPVLKDLGISFGRALAEAEKDLAPLRKDARIDLSAVNDVQLPSDVAEAIVAATVQALSNSVTHAGPAARRVVVGTPLDGGGIRISISDDGSGFDLSEVARERLGVRVSILERVRLTGASAQIRSSRGRGTTVLLEWRPAGTARTGKRRSSAPRISLVPRRQLSRVLAALIGMAILTAVSEAALFSRAPGPLVAAVLGLTILPALLRGARTGTMRPRTAWAMATAGLLLCCTATIGLDPGTVDCVSMYWYTCGVLAGAVMVWMTGNRAAPIVVVAFQFAQLTLWAGPTGAIRLGLAGETVLVIAGLMMLRAIRRISASADVSAGRQRELTIRQAELDAFHLERQDRLRHASADAAPMLNHIVAQNGQLDSNARSECRVLEQALRDEIRGRGLLNRAVRTVVSTHRRRGAYVQVLDDGGLDTIDPDTLDPLLDEVAHRLNPLTSSRIVIRSGPTDSDTAITIVASTPDETAAALGTDTDNDIDLWVTIPRPSPVLA